MTAIVGCGGALLWMWLLLKVCIILDDYPKSHKVRDLFQPYNAPTFSSMTYPKMKKPGLKRLFLLKLDDFMYWLRHDTIPTADELRAEWEALEYESVSGFDGPGLPVEKGVPTLDEEQ